MATQALVNPIFGPRGLRLLAQAVAAADVVRVLLAGDDGRETRQLHVIDAAGRNAAHTGKDCIDWCGHLLRPGFSIAGNMLVGPRVIEDTAEFYDSHAALPFAARLIGALDAGQAAGGDKRGKQSAALLIYSTEAYADLNLRVDDHAEPLAELRRLYDKAHERFIPYLGCAPSSKRLWGEFDRARLEEAIVRYRKPS